MLKQRHNIMSFWEDDEGISVNKFQKHNNKNPTPPHRRVLNPVSQNLSVLVSATESHFQTCCCFTLEALANSLEPRSLHAVWPSELSSSEESLPLLWLPRQPYQKMSKLFSLHFCFLCFQLVLEFSISKLKVLVLICVDCYVNQIDNWSVKAILRKTTGTGRMRYLRHSCRR